MPPSPIRRMMRYRAIVDGEAESAAVWAAAPEPLPTEVVIVGASPDAVSNPSSSKQRGQPPASNAPPHFAHRFGSLIGGWNQSRFHGDLGRFLDADRFSLRFVLLQDIRVEVRK